MTESPTHDASVDPPTVLPAREVFWRDRYDWLQSIGYTLRPRYKPDWIPSWIKTNELRFRCEDNVRIARYNVIDAVRDSDGVTVVFKQVHKSARSDRESSIGVLFSSPELTSDPRNHCCPILDVVDDPFDDTMEYIIMPLLRTFFDPKMETVGEAVEFFRQAFEGLQFMHEHHVTHRDISALNIMMDSRPILPGSFHPQSPWNPPGYKGSLRPRSRTRHPVNYYITDFGLSQIYDANDPNPLAFPAIGGDKTVPEFQNDTQTPRNPFHTDVYYMGNLVRTFFLDIYKNLGFMDVLIGRMVQPEPDKRPSMDEAVASLKDIIKHLSSFQLRQRLVETEDGTFINIVKGIYHFSYRTVPNVLALKSPLPTPKSK